MFDAVPLDAEFFLELGDVFRMGFLGQVVAGLLIGELLAEELDFFPRFPELVLSVIEFRESITRISEEGTDATDEGFEIEPRILGSLSEKQYLGATEH